MAPEFANTPPARAPTRSTLQGRYVRLEPLGTAHATSLYEAIAQPPQSQRFEFLAETPPQSESELTQWIAARQALADPLFSAVVDQGTGRTLGRQALMRITPEHGVIEIGSILWCDGMARTRLATEALYLAARHVFEDLGYRRFEWKCNALNAPSRRAALRFGFQFEGIFRQHMWIKGRSRDTAWFAMLDSQWPALRAAYDAWLQPDNFAPDGRQRRPLAAAATPAAAAP
jgi:RimJ/RimL family protein N-acetyltransferase